MRFNLSKWCAPDYFSSTGQLWGTPTYFGQNIRDLFDYGERFKRQFELVDLLRLIISGGLAGYWRVNGNSDRQFVANG